MWSATRSNFFIILIEAYKNHTATVLHHRAKKSVVFISAIPGQPFEHECLHEKIERKQTGKPANSEQGKGKSAECFMMWPVGTSILGES